MMDDLFGTTSSTAEFSRDGRYRYRLDRRWTDGPTAVFVMLNPSTADADQDDPTIRRCIGFARAWGCGALTVVNVYAYRSTSPAGLWGQDDPVGPDNLATIARVLAEPRRGGPVVVAWGAHARRPEVLEVVRVAQEAGVRLHALRVSATTGAPWHPLYLPAASCLMRWPVVGGVGTWDAPGGGA